MTRISANFLQAEVTIAQMVILFLKRMQNFCGSGTASIPSVRVSSKRESSSSSPN
jgi:hypothetical protein